MGPPAPAVDLPDPLDSSEDQPVGNSEDLLSQLAGDAVDRMMAGEPAQPAEPQPQLNPVQELTSQLDTFFEELRERQAEAAAAIDAIPEANPIEINDQERAALDASDEPAEETRPKDLITSYESKKPTPLLLRPLDRWGARVESLSPVARFVISMTALLSFIAACAALAYVLIMSRI
jgi:hypothetical protein